MNHLSSQQISRIPGRRPHAGTRGPRPRMSAVRRQASPPGIIAFALPQLGSKFEGDQIHDQNVFRKRNHGRLHLAADPLRRIRNDSIAWHLETGPKDDERIGNSHRPQPETLRSRPQRRRGRRRPLAHRSQQRKTPKPAPRVFTPPRVDPTYSKLPMVPTIIGEVPNINAPNYGDPLGKMGAPSNGTGFGGGIGSGIGVGVGSGAQGFGGGVYSDRPRRQFADDPP